MGTRGKSDIWGQAVQNDVHILSVAPDNPRAWIRLAVPARPRPHKSSYMTDRDANGKEKTLLHPVGFGVQPWSLRGEAAKWYVPGACALASWPVSDGVIVYIQLQYCTVQSEAYGAEMDLGMLSRG